MVCVSIGEYPPWHGLDGDVIGGPPGDPELSDVVPILGPPLMVHQVPSTKISPFFSNLP